MDRMLGVKDDVIQKQEELISGAKEEVAGCLQVLPSSPLPSVPLPHLQPTSASQVARYPAPVPGPILQLPPSTCSLGGWEGASTPEEKKSAGPPLARGQP